MGAWGPGPFENDDAMDFIGDLADGPTAELPDRLREALTLPEGYIESPEGAEAIAAAALVAARQGYNPNDPTVSDLLAGHPFNPDEDLRSAAVAAIGRVSGSESELMELWDEAALRDSFEAILTNVKTFL